MNAADGVWEDPITNEVDNEMLRYGGEQVLDIRDLFVLHAVLLHTGKVLMFSGHAEGMYYAPVAYVLDPASGELTRRPFPQGMDLFCCHYVQLEDGRILVVGGSDPDFVTHSSRGAKNIVLFDPDKGGDGIGDWVETGEALEQGRWYPTAVILGDGRVVVVSGRLEPGVTDPLNSTEPGTNIATKVEVVSPPDFKPRTLTGAGKRLPLYPGLHLAPDGRIYFTNTTWGQEIDNPERTPVLEVVGNTGLWHKSIVPSAEIKPMAQPLREEGMSVLLPPAHDGKILVVGGSLALASAPKVTPVVATARTGNPRLNFNHVHPDIDPRHAEILTTGPQATWETIGPTTYPRINGHLVLLPDATVLVCGGHDNYRWLPPPNTKVPPKPNVPKGVTNPSRIAEIFTPGVGFEPVAEMEHARMYHSVALLLPDGRVMVAGGADPSDYEPVLNWQNTPAWPQELTWSATEVLNRKDREYYKPPYFYKGDRPKIVAVQRFGVGATQIPYGATFVILTDVPADDIETVVLMRPGAPTHHTDSEQRYEPLTFTVSGAKELGVAMPGSGFASVLPPGYYMLWIVDKQKRPCEKAHWVHVPGPPRPASQSSCAVATVATGAADAPEVLLLRRVRRELREGTAAGRWFVKAVNGFYYSFSPALAAWLAGHERARAAVRDVLVRPGAAATRAAERVTAPLKPLGLRHSVLMVALVLCALVALAAGPPALLAHLLVRRGEVDDAS